MFVEVEIPCHDVAEAGTIAQLAVEGNLAAYAYTFPVTSRYPWTGEVEFTEYETILVLRTVRERIPELVMLVREHHSYKVPPIVARELVYVHHDYADWLLNTVSSESDAS